VYVDQGRCAPGEDEVPRENPRVQIMVVTNMPPEDPDARGFGSIAKTRRARKFTGTAFGAR
jgi:hypothetical protein